MLDCLLCNQKFINKEILKDHYVSLHKVDKSNEFFKNLMRQKKKKVVYKRNCSYCHEFVLINKAEHDFLKHYMNDEKVDKLDVDEDAKPLDVTSYGDIKKFEITFKEHSNHYDFFDSVALVDQFLAEIKNYVFRYNHNMLIRAGFSIENIQFALSDYSEPLTQTRYWSTEPLSTKSFNDFISFKLRESILKRVVNNRASGSAWMFNRFIYLNVKIIQTATALMK